MYLDMFIYLHSQHVHLFHYGTRFCGISRTSTDHILLDMRRHARALNVRLFRAAD
jgi:hypothetical protein